MTRCCTRARAADVSEPAESLFSGKTEYFVFVSKKTHPLQKKTNVFKELKSQTWKSPVELSVQSADMTVSTALPGASQRLRELGTSGAEPTVLAPGLEREHPDSIASSLCAFNRHCWCVIGVGGPRGWSEPCAALGPPGLVQVCAQSLLGSQAALALHVAWPRTGSSGRCGLRN